MSTLSQAHAPTVRLDSVNAADLYGRATAALARLQQVPQDDAARLAAAQALLQLGLGGPAREILEQVGEGVRSHPEFASLLQIPERAGRASWEQHRPSFEANLQALDPATANSIRDAWTRQQHRFELFHDSLGNLQARYRLDDGTWIWIPSLVDHAKAAATEIQPQDRDESMPGPYLFDGIALGFSFAHLHARTKETFLGYSCALQIVEPDPALLAVALHLHDWRKVLRDERVMVFTGPDAVAQYRALMTDEPDIPLPCLMFSLCRHRPPPSPDLAATIHAINEDRLHRGAESAQALAGQYEGRGPAYWADRYRSALDGEGPPLRIIAAVSSHTSFLKYSMRDAQQAVENLGHEFRIVSEQKCFDRVSVEGYHRQIQAFDPDLFFVIDHIRPEFGLIVPANLPVMSWDQDALPGYFNAEKVKGFTRLDTVVGLPQYDCLTTLGCDPRQFLVSLMPTNPRQFDSSGLSEEDLAPYRCDVSYVSHASQTAEEFHQSEIKANPDPLVRRLLDDLYPRAVAHVRGGQTIRQLSALLVASEQHTGVYVPDTLARARIIRWYLWRLCDRVFRHQALEWAAEWAQANHRTLRIYGNGWEKHPTLAAFAAGPAENGKELLCIYRASAINLQLMPAGFLHQRALDGLAAGGFFLTRATASERPDPRCLDLWQRISEAGFTTAAELLDSDDHQLIDDFRQLAHLLGHRTPQAQEEFLMAMRVDEVTDRAQDVLPRFDEIVFDDATSFQRLADRFLADEADRTEVARRMRQVVVERYSYEGTLLRFLTFARDYFQSIRSEA